MRDNFYIKLMGEHDWYIFKISDVRRTSDYWIAKCHSKADAEMICSRLNGNS